MTDKEIYEHCVIMSKHVKKNKKGIDMSGQNMFGADKKTQEMYFKIYEYMSKMTSEEKEEFIARSKRIEREYKIDNHLLE